MKHAAPVLLMFVGCAWLTGCNEKEKEKVLAGVFCVAEAEPSSRVATCSITQSQGRREVEVCFDFSASCDDGAMITAPRRCAKIRDGVQVDDVITTAQLEGIEHCRRTKPPEVKVENITVDGKRI